MKTFLISVPFLKRLKKVTTLIVYAAYGELLCLRQLPLGTLRVTEVANFQLMSSNEKMLNSTLEELTIIHCNILGELPRFPKLKLFGFALNKISSDFSLPDWIKEHSDTLETLQFREFYFRPAYFLEVFKSCRNVRTLVLYVTSPKKYQSSSSKISKTC